MHEPSSAAPIHFHLFHLIGPYYDREIHQNAKISPRRERDKTKINNETNRAYNDREDYYTASADRREEVWSPGQSLGDPLSACRTDQTVLSEPTVSGESGPIDEPSSSTGGEPKGAMPRRQADRMRIARSRIRART